jgi:hypothetical protein
VFDVSDLRAPEVVGVYEGTSTAIDHNQYIRGGHTFQSNYASGLRVLDLGGVASATLREIGFFDVRPEDDRPDYIGTWTNYPFFASGIVIVSSIERGLFVLRPNLSPLTGADLVVSELSASAVTGAGLPFEVTDTTRNLGAAPAAASHTEFYLSMDGLFDETDVFLGERHVDALAAGAEDAGETTLDIPPETASGAYYVLAVSDTHQDAVEEIENNNVRPRFVNLGPDLVVTALTSPASAIRGTQVPVTDTTKNAGGAGAGSTMVRLVLSKNKKVGADDVELGTHQVAALGAGESRGVTTAVVIPSSTVPGVYQIIAIADAGDEIDEFAETNNILSRKVTIQ